MKKTVSFMLLLAVMIIAAIPSEAKHPKKRSSGSSAPVAATLNIQPSELISDKANFADFVGEDGLEYLPDECKNVKEIFKLKSLQEIEENLKNTGFVLKGSTRVKLNICSDGSSVAGKCYDYVKEGVTVKLYVRPDSDVEGTPFLEEIKIVFPNSKLKNSFTELLENMGFKKDDNYYSSGEWVGVMVSVKGNTCQIYNFNQLVG